MYDAMHFDRTKIAIQLLIRIDVDAAATDDYVNKNCIERFLLIFISSLIN